MVIVFSIKFFPDKGSQANTPFSYSMHPSTKSNTNNGKASNCSADQANKTKLILLLGGFNNTGELESQLKRISMPPISSEPLHALMIIECHQYSYTVQWISFDIRIQTLCCKSMKRVSFPLVTCTARVHIHTHFFFIYLHRLPLLGTCFRYVQLLKAKRYNVKS